MLPADTILPFATASSHDGASSKTLQQELLLIAILNCLNFSRATSQITIATKSPHNPLLKRQQNLLEQPDHALGLAHDGVHLIEDW